MSGDSKTTVKMNESSTLISEYIKCGLRNQLKKSMRTNSPTEMEIPREPECTIVGYNL